MTFTSDPARNTYDKQKSRYKYKKSLRISQLGGINTKQL